VVPEIAVVSPKTAPGTPLLEYLSYVSSLADMPAAEQADLRQLDLRQPDHRQADLRLGGSSSGSPGCHASGWLGRVCVADPEAQRFAVTQGWSVSVDIAGLSFVCMCARTHARAHSHARTHKHTWSPKLETLTPLPRTLTPLPRI
jgi:hypothetical protein